MNPICPHCGGEHLLAKVRAHYYNVPLLANGVMYSEGDVSEDWMEDIRCGDCGKSVDIDYYFTDLEDEG